MDLRERLREQWIESAHDWIETDQTVRIEFLDVWMLRALGRLRGRSVIDIGCGEGRFSRLMAARGAKVTGVDLTEAFIDRARRMGEGQTYLLGDAERLDGVASEQFDVAVAYITLDDIHDHRRSIGEAFRVLRPGGRFVACCIHPIKSALPGGWIRRGSHKLFYPVDNYLEEGPREFRWWGRDFLNMHRPLSEYISAFLAAGFVVAGIEEPAPSSELVAERPEFGDDLRAPTFIIYVLDKPSS